MNNVSAEQVKYLIGLAAMILTLIVCRLGYTESNRWFDKHNPDERTQEEKDDRRLELQARRGRRPGI